MNRRHSFFQCSFDVFFKQLLRIFLIALVTPAAIAASPSLSDADARKLVEQFVLTWKNTITTGRLAVLSPGFKPTEGKSISSDWLKILQGWQQAGIVSITEVPIPPSERWNQPAGTVKLVDVAMTQQGKKYSVPENPSRLELRVARKVTVTSVLKNEPKVIGAYDYRLLMGVLEREVNDDVQKYYSVSGNPASPSARFVMLWKFDPFLARWVIDVWDIANGNQQFQTNRVEQALVGSTSVR